jgi:hypothetical protein
MPHRPIALLLLLGACAGGGLGPLPAPTVAPTELGLDGAITPLAAPLTVSAGSWSHLGNLCATTREQGMADSRRIGPTVRRFCGTIAVTQAGGGRETVTVTISDGPTAGLVVSGERDVSGSLRALRASGPLVERMPTADRATLDAAAGRISEMMPTFPPGTYTQGQVVTMAGPASTAQGLRSTCTVNGRGEIRRREVIALTCESRVPISAMPAMAGMVMRGEAVGTSLVLIETATGAKRRDKSVTETAGSATETRRGTTVPFSMTISTTVTLD